MKAHELLEKPESWTQGEFARNRSGERTNSNCPTACSWCMIGAMFKCYKGDELYTGLFKAISDHIGDVEIYKWNDDPNRTHAEVVDLLKKLDL